MPTNDASDNQPAYVQILSGELQRRRNKNPRYSLRAFAYAMQVDASSLSRILSRKQVPSAKRCLKFLEKLKLPTETQSAFLASVMQERARNEYLHVARCVRKDHEAVHDTHDVPQVDAG